MRTKVDMSFTGERFVPGKSGRTIEYDHLERYYLSQSYVEGKSVLDIACGAGYSSEMMIKAGANNYLGADISLESVNYASNMYISNKIKFIVGDICEFKYENQFDVITCFETIEHVECYKKALNNLYALLKKDGTLLISSPNRVVTTPKAKDLKSTPKNPYHTQEFSIDELKKEVTNAGFGIKEVFGQRQRPFYKNKLIHFLIKITRFPDIFAYLSPAKLKPVKFLTPRYFVIIAYKI